MTDAASAARPMIAATQSTMPTTCVAVVPRAPVSSQESPFQDGLTVATLKTC